jgi:hypothetical protein
MNSFIAQENLMYAKNFNKPKQKENFFQKLASNFKISGSDEYVMSASYREKIDTLDHRRREMEIIKEKKI